jgi:hypothetical protein
MTRTDYEALLIDLCVAACIDDSATVLKTHHIDVAGRTIGLIPHPASAEHLSVYIDLGAIYPSRDTRLQSLMLAANMQPSCPVSGAFAMNDQTCEAAFRLSVTLPVTGIQLAERVEQALQYAVTHFDAMRHEAGT